MKVRAKTLWLLVPLLSLGMRLASEPTANASYLVLAGFALAGRSQAVHALALVWLFGLLSPGLAPNASADSLGRYAVIAAAALSVVLRMGLSRRSTQVSWPVLATALVGLFLLLHSFLFSPMVDVSALKAVSWSTVLLTLLSAWGGMEEDVKAKTENQLFFGLVAVMLASLPLVFMPLGYLRNGSGFQGVLSHPQAFGLSMALLGTWGASRMLGESRPQWRLVMLVAICVVLVVLSETRTAGLAMLVGVSTAMFTIPLLANRSIKAALPGVLSTRVHLVLFLGAGAMLVAGPLIADRISDYLVKRSESDTLVEAYGESRGHLIHDMWLNVQARPLTGTGFGIASTPQDMVVVRDPIMNLPVSASIEKGVMPLAVLEEIGLFGFAFVVAWLWLMIRRAAKRGVAALSVTLTILLLNMGESTLFSAGGVGLVTLILLGWAVSARPVPSRNA